MTPDPLGFAHECAMAVYGRQYDEVSMVRDFRRLFLSDPALGKRVMFTMLVWCGEYLAAEEIPTGEALQRWAGRREIAARIKAAMHADLSTPLNTEEDDPRD